MEKQNYLVNAWLMARAGTRMDQKMRQVMSLSMDEAEAYETAEARLEREFGGDYTCGRCRAS